MHKPILILYVSIFVGVFMIYNSECEANPHEPVIKEWKKVLAWMNTNHPTLIRLLNSPATDSQIKNVESELGYSIPQSLVELLKLNDGESKNSQGIFGAWRLMPLSEQLKDIKTLSDDKRYPKTRLHPFLVSGGGDYYCIDIRDGRIIEWWQEGGENGEIAKDLSEFIKVFNKKLLSGKYLILEDFRGLVDRDDL